MCFPGILTLGQDSHPVPFIFKQILFSLMFRLKFFTLILSEKIRALFLVLVIFKRRSLAIIFRSSFDHKCESEKLSYRKKVLINFQKFISQERHIRISISTAHCFYLKYSSNRIYVQNQNMIFFENRNYEFRLKITKSFINVL